MSGTLSFGMVLLFSVVIFIMSFSTCRENTESTEIGVVPSEGYSLEYKKTC